MRTTPPVVLTIAGSDSGGGAGIQADLKTFEAHGVFGVTAIAALTAQNTLGVRGVYNIPPDFIRAQLAAVFDDFTVAAVKIGMLSQAAVIEAVADYLASVAHRPPIVLDPVMVATSGDELLEAKGIEALKAKLFPLATVLTPNVPEAEALLGRRIQDVHAAKSAAVQLSQQAGSAWVLLKGAHLNDVYGAAPQEAVDILAHGTDVQRFTAPFHAKGHLHGTGCTLSSAIAARLALGASIPEAVNLAKRYVTAAIEAAPAGLGQGARPLRHCVVPV